MQKTLKKSVSFQGIGLHSGHKVTLTITPSETDEGLTIERSDIPNSKTTLSWDKVVPSELCTLLKWQTDDGEDVSVSTVEHVLSALRGVGVDNAHLIVDGPEIPIMDGSAIEFLTAFDNAGYMLQSGETKAIRILKAIRYEDGDRWVEFHPSNLPLFNYTVEFEAASIGEQTFSCALINGNYAHDIAAARTFTTRDMVETLQAKGLIQGGSLDNAVVYDGDKVLNPEGTRFVNEAVRHKMLDAIGDLYLAGASIIGEFRGYKAGHAMHSALLKEMFADPTSFEIIHGDSNVNAGILNENTDKIIETVHA